MTREREEELRLEGRAGAARVEIREERVAAPVAHDGRVEPRGQPLGEQRLAQANGAFDGEIAKVQPAAKV